MKCKKILAGTMAAVLMLSTSALAAGGNYSDVKDTDWFAPAVHIASVHELMNGVDTEIFAPNGTMTRAMVVQVLYNHAGRPELHNSSAFFTDVTADQWYYNAVQWAAENSIASGVGDGKFAPNANVTRQEFAVFLHRYCGDKLWYTRANFADSKDIAGWAQDAMAWAVHKNIINGVKQDDGTLLLKPNDNAVRAQAAQMLSNYLNATFGHTMTYHKATTHTETVKITDERDETIYGKFYVCNGCGAQFETDDEAAEHIAAADITSDCQNYSLKLLPIGSEHHDAVYKEITVSDNNAYYTCDICGYRQNIFETN